MRRNTALCLIFGSLLAGLVLGRLGVAVPPVAVAAVAVVAVVLAVASQGRLIILALVILAIILGVWRTAGWAAQQGQLVGLIDQAVAIDGIVADDPATSATTRQVDFKLTDMTDSGRRLPGTLSVHSIPIRLQRGYRVHVEGKVKPGFGNMPVELSFPKISITSMTQDPLEQFRQRFFAGMRTALVEPTASFGLGLLVGIRALIPKDMQATLALVGLSHLVAVSGYNLTILVQAIERLFGRFGRGTALAVSLWVIVGFLIVTGGSASIVRASLVSVLSLLAAFYGRRFNPLVLILLTASATAAFNPSYLTDLGWLLSFFAFFGILVLAPAVEARLGNPKPVLIKLFIESMAAQIVTIPIILCFFDQLSIVSPITNLIILPMVPLAMATSFVAGLAGLFIPAFAGWLAWPAALLLDFMIRIINAFAALPFAGRTDHFSPAAMVAAYAIILVLTIFLVRSNHRAHRHAEPTIMLR